MKQSVWLDVASWWGGGISKLSFTADASCFIIPFLLTAACNSLLGGAGNRVYIYLTLC